MAAKVVSFEGTSTKNTYVVGKSYSMNGETYKANADGSFTNNSSGQKLVGSSQSSTAVFNVSGGSAGGKENGPSKAVVVKAATPAKGTPGKAGYVAPKPPVLAVVTPGTGPGTPGVGVPVAVSKPKPGKDAATELFMWGAPVTANPNTDDAQKWENRYGEGDFLNPVWFAQWGIAIADIPPSAARWIGQSVKEMAEPPSYGAMTAPSKVSDYVVFGTGVMGGNSPGPNSVVNPPAEERYGFGWPI